MDYPQRKPWKRYKGLSKASFPSSDKAPDRRETRDLALFDLVIDSKLRACSKMRHLERLNFSHSMSFCAYIHNQISQPPMAWIGT
jgi:hypothetical protein